MSDRLDRIETLLETLVIESQQYRLDLVQTSRHLQEGLMQTDQMTKRNAAAIARLDEKMNQFIEQSAQDRETITSEMRGLRTEMQRLIETTLG